MSQFNNIVHNKSSARLSSNVSLVVVLVDPHTLVVVAVANTVVDHRHSAPSIVEAIAVADSRTVAVVAVAVVDSRIVAAVVADSRIAAVVADGRIAAVVEDSSMAVAEESSYYNPDKRDIVPEICSNGLNPIEEIK